MKIIPGREEDSAERESEKTGVYQLSRQEEDALAEFINQRLREARQRGEERTRFASSMQLASINPDLFYIYGHNLADPAIQQIHQAVQGDNIEEVTRNARNHILDTFFGKGHSNDLYFQLTRELVEEAWGEENFTKRHADRAMETVYQAYLQPQEHLAGINKKDAESYVRKKIENKTLRGEEEEEEEQLKVNLVDKALARATAQKKAFSTLVQCALQVLRERDQSIITLQRSPEQEQEIKTAAQLTGISLEDMITHVNLQNTTGGSEARLNACKKEKQIIYHAVKEKMESYSAPENIVGFVLVEAQIRRDIERGYEKHLPKELMLRKMSALYRGEGGIKAGKTFHSLKAMQIIDRFKPEIKREGPSEIIDREKESTAIAYEKIIAALSGLELQREYVQQAIEVGIIYAGVGAEQQAKALLTLGEKYLAPLLEAFQEEDPVPHDERFASQILVALANGYSLLGDVAKTEGLLDAHYKNMDRNAPEYAWRDGQLVEVPVRELATTIERRAYLHAIRQGRVQDVDQSDREDLLQYFIKKRNDAVRTVQQKIDKFKGAYGMDLPGLQKQGWRDMVQDIADSHHAEVLALLTEKDGMPRNETNLYKILEIEP